jgi:NDP-sugar pyrophosphorylase family protein
MNAVIMAGGLGTRLRPLTYAIPKPLIPIGDKPILEILLGQLQRAGFQRAIISTGYKAELIRSYFADGARLGIDIRYVVEQEPLGTAGALNLMRDQLDEPFIMVNGDILTRLDFAALLAGHAESGADMTAVAAQHQTQIPYGVIESNGSRVERVVEKPTHTHPILAGIYALSPSALDRLPESGRFDVPDLIHKVIETGGTVRRHEMEAFWLDVGRMDDFEAALEVVQSWGDL